MASAMRQPWAKPNWVSTVAGGGQAEVLDEVLPQEPHRDRVEQERPLPGEADDAALRVQLEQLLVVQVLGAHRLFDSFVLKFILIHID